MAAELLVEVGIPDARRRVNEYPFEFSGGMRQRAMIAMAISCNPDILIADEPTTALDVTIQAQIMDVIREMQTQYNSGVILITHDLGVVAQMADKVMVMYGGRTVESGPVDEVFYNPHQPYTWGLLASLPRLDETEKQRLTPIKGQPPNLLLLPPGCPFAGRCPYELPAVPRPSSRPPRSSGRSTPSTAGYHATSARASAPSCRASPRGSHEHPRSHRAQEALSHQVGRAQAHDGVRVRRRRRLVLRERR